jgi:hypothetical protein
MPQFNTFMVTASSDDAYQDSGGTADTTATAATIGTGTVGAATKRVCGFRFLSVNIPNKATIDAAIPMVSKRNTAFATVTGTWFGQLAANAATFSTGEDLDTARTKTSASVACAAENINRIDLTRYGFPQDTDLKAIIQEIVNQATWASGNALVLLFVGDGGSSFASSEINQYDNATTSAMRLAVTWRVGTETTVRHPV